MSDNYEVRCIEDYQAWDDFVTCAIGGSIFSTRAWLDCAARATGKRFRCYGVFKNDSLLAGVSGLESRHMTLSRLVTPDLTPYGGLQFSALPSKGPAKLEIEWGRATDLLIEHLLGRYDRVQLSLAPAVEDVRKFVWAKWSAQVRYTYEIDLSDLNALWERLERRTRTVLRKAQNAGFEMRAMDDLDLFRRQFELIYAKQNIVPPVDPALVCTFAKYAVTAGLARTHAAVSPSGEIASMVVFVQGFDTLYAWLAGADPAFNPTGATSLLYWSSFEQAKHSKFDFVGANIPAIAKFKRGFGGDLKSYFLVDGFKNAAFRAVVTCKGALQALRASRTPQ